MNDLICEGLRYYFYIGLIYSAIAEYKYWVSDEFIIDGPWLVGAIISGIFLSVFRTLGWFPLIALDMRKSYIASKSHEDDDL